MEYEQVIRFSESANVKARKIASLPSDKVEAFINERVASGQFGFYEVYASKYSRKPYWIACRPRVKQ